MRKWISVVVESEGHTLGELNFIFCSDHYLLDINIKFLDHDYFTDIITFSHDNPDAIAGDLFLSFDRMAENASNLNKSFDDELHRVMVHGVLHLLGYSDKSAGHKLAMTAREDYHLARRDFNSNGAK